MILIGLDSVGSNCAIIHNKMDFAKRNHGAWRAECHSVSFIERKRPK